MVNNIEKIMREADAAGFGVSYGKYMASKRTAPTPETEPAAKKHPARICPECEMEFLPNRSDQRYCSDPCRIRHHKREQNRKRQREQYHAKPKLPIGQANCPHCGKEFYRNTTTRMFCSMTCAALVRNEERRQKKRETSSEG